MKHFIILTTLILLSSNVLYSQTDNKTLYRSENRPLIPKAPSSILENVTISGNNKVK